MPAHPNPTRTLLVLAVGLLPVALGQNMLIPAIPQMARDLNVSTADVAWVFAAFFVVAAASSPIFGRIGDMFGKRRMIVIASFAYAVGAIVSASVANLWVILAGRLLQGLGGCLFPLCFSLAHELLPPKRRAAGISVLSAIAGAGSGVGLVFGGLISDHLSYSWIFWFSAAFALPVTVALRFLLPESPVRVGGRVDVSGAVVLAIGLALPLFGISRAATWGWGDPRVLALIGGGVAVLVLWVFLERRTRAPLIDLELLRRPSVATTNVATLLLGFGTYSTLVLGVELAQTARTSGYGFGASATDAGLLLLPGCLTIIVFAPLSAKVGKRLGHGVPLAIGAVVAGASLLSLAYVHATEFQLSLLVAIGFIGIGFAYAASVNLIIDCVPRAQIGEATGVNSVLFRVGLALGTQVSATLLAASASGGSLLPSDSGYRDAFLVAALVAFASALASGVARSRRRGVALEIPATPPA
jgi:MFS family permease